MSGEKIEVVPLSKMREVVDHFFAYLILTVLSQLRYQLCHDSISKAEVYGNLVRLGEVLKGKVYCRHDYQGLIYMSTVWQCRKYRRNHYDCRIEHPLVSRIMIIEFNMLTC